MEPDPRFQSQPESFWAYVRSLSEWVGYTHRGAPKIKIPELLELRAALEALGLALAPVLESDTRPTRLGRLLLDYFQQRTHVLNNEVEPALMNAVDAERVYEDLRRRLRSPLRVTMNKQTGGKKKPAYLTGIVGMLIESERGKWPCDHDPRALTAFTRAGVPLRTLSRRVDGAFPSVVNPVAIWEIKEYYHTTTFGSRVADGVYETRLDGLELAELRKSEGVPVKHYLFLDAHYTWWQCGRSYLCRIYDMVNMGLVDEVVVGRDVLLRLPLLVAEWRELAEARSRSVF